MVVERPLVEVRVLGLGLPAEHVLREFQHVVGVARLGGVAGQMRSLGGLRKEVLVLAVAADDEGIVVGHEVPEIRRHRAGLGVARHLVGAGLADHLRDLGVGMLADQVVMPVREERVEDGLVIEASRRFQVARVSGEPVDFDQHVHHPAVLDLEHGLVLLRREPGRDRARPVGEPKRHVARLGVAGQHPSVLEAVQDLVLGVPGHPRAALEVVRALQVHDAVADVAQRLELEGLEGPDVAVAVAVLAKRQLGHDVVDALLEAQVAGRRVLLRERRQVVAEGVPGEPELLPAAVGLRLRRQPGVFPGVVQQAVGV